MAAYQDGKKVMELNINRISNKTCIVEIPNEMTDQDETPLLLACGQSGQAELRHIILNFSALERMNGLGASMLVKLGAQARNRDLQLFAGRLAR